MTTAVTDLLASKFIARKDVKAIQKGSAYMPVTTDGKVDSPRIKWSRNDLDAHVAGDRSYGHYLVSADNKCKLFAFDIDLNKSATWLGIEADGTWSDMEPKQCNPREAWLHPKAPDNLRRFLTSQLREVAEDLARTTIDVLGLPVAVAYSGNKGVHVYGFTGLEQAEDVYQAAQEVISFSGHYESLRGKNFYRPADRSLKQGNEAVEIEVFPKQGNLDGKDLGNLMRLPLGVHAKSRREAYFVDCASPIDSMPSLDPVRALEGTNPWQK